MITYNDETGAAEGLEQRMLISQGFRVGSRVSVKEGKANAGATLLTQHIREDGLVKLKAIDEEGPVVKAAYHFFLRGIASPLALGKSSSSTRKRTLRTTIASSSLPFRGCS